MEGIAEKFLKTYADDISEMIAYFNKWTGLDASGLVAVKYLYHLGDKLSSEVIIRVLFYTRIIIIYKIV